jgi:UDP-glucose 4-epimerase
MRVLITGATGFLGSHLLRGLDGYSLVAASRRLVPTHEWRPLTDLSRDVDWYPLLRGVDVVVHLANVAHRAAGEADFDEVNHRATARLCVAAKRSGLKHLVFVSSIGAQVGHAAEHVVTEADPPRPVSAYGRSKLAAEGAVAASGVPFTILRPVLVIGSGARGNAASLEKLARLPIPLPLGSLKAKRSVLSVENFISGVSTVLGHPDAFGETFIMADHAPLTVGDLVAAMRAELGRRPGIFALPGGLLELCLALPGGQELRERIASPLVACSAKLMSLGWVPTR